MIVGLCARLDVLELPHLKHFSSVHHLPRLLVFALRHRIMGQGRSSGVASRVRQAEWLFGLSKVTVFGSDHSLGFLTVVIRNHISDWGAWSISFAVRVSLLRQEH